MMDLVLMISLISNAFTLYVLKHIIGYYSKRVTMLEKEIEWVSLKVRMLQ